MIVWLLDVYTLKIVSSMVYCNTVVLLKVVDQVYMLSMYPGQIIKASCLFRMDLIEQIRLS